MSNSPTLNLMAAVMRRLRGTNIPPHFLNHPTLGLGALASDLSLRGQADIINPLYRFSDTYRPEHFRDFDRAGFSYGSMLRTPNLVEWPAFPDVQKPIDLGPEGFLGYTSTIPREFNLDELHFDPHMQNGMPGNGGGYPAEDHANFLADTLATLYNQYPNLQTVGGVAPTPFYDYPMHVRNDIRENTKKYLEGLR